MHHKKKFFIITDFNKSSKQLPQYKSSVKTITYYSKHVLNHTGNKNENHKMQQGNIRDRSSKRKPFFP